MSLKRALYAAAGLLIASVILLFNLAIYFSSKPHYHQMGWAIFCGVNACFLALGAFLLLVAAESDTIDTRDFNRRRQEANV